MQNLQQLSLALRNGAQGKAKLAGLDEQYGDAKGLRDSQGASINKYGTASPLAVVADVINNSRGRKGMREIAPTRAAARTNVAANANALPLYNAQQKQNATTQAQTNYEQTRTDGLSQFRKQQEDIAAQNKIKNSEVVELVSLTDPADVKQATVRGGQFFDINSGQPLDPQGYKQKTQFARGSGSRYTFPKMKDAYGNDIIGRADKQSGELTPFKFADGSDYDEVKAAQLGGTIASQAGLETEEKESAKLTEQRKQELSDGTKSRAQSLLEANNAIKALEAGAGSGSIESNLPVWLLPNEAETTKLRNAKQKLGLEQIGEHTFGSLSEAEGLWVQQSQIPDLDEDELLPYMKHRRSAMMRVNKAAEYEREALEAGEPIDTGLITEMLTGDGFDMSEYGYK